MVRPTSRRASNPTIASAVVVGLLASACDEAGDRPARWGYIHAAIITPSCTTAGCHSGLTALAGLNLSSRDGAYNVLVGRVCGSLESPIEPPGNFVFPGQPERSKLLYLLRGDDVDVMPPDTPLPDVEIAIIERWILEGAECD